MKHNGKEVKSQLANELIKLIRKRVACAKKATIKLSKPAKNRCKIFGSFANKCDCINVDIDEKLNINSAR